MAARLLWRDAQGIEGFVDVAVLDVFVGRGMDCAIRTDDPMVSRRHARIFYQDGRHVIEDLGSANGVFVGDNRVRMHIFTHGDAVRCGNLWVRYVNESPQAQVAPQQQYGNTGGQWGQPPPAAPAYGAPPPAAQSYGAPPPYGAPPAAAPYGAPPAPYGAPPPAAPYGGGGGGGGGFGPPPAAGGPPPAASQPRPSGPVSAQNVPPGALGTGLGSGGGAAAAGSPEKDKEIARLTRRVEQMQTEMRMLRGGGDKAVRMEELEAKLAKAEAERDDAMAKAGESAGRLAAESGDVKVQRAGQLMRVADESIAGLNDVLSEIRINVMAAEAEVEQWATQLPKAQFELVREALRSCRSQMEAAKDIIKKLQSVSK